MKTAENTDLAEKAERLAEILLENSPALIAFSGGVDSSFLVKSASVNSAGSAAVIVKSVFTPNEEYLSAVNFAKETGIRLFIVETDILQNESVVSNPPDRCYFCKRAIFESVISLAAANNFKSVMDGTNADDIHEYRPGMKALRELGVISPLLEAGLTKSEVRLLSKQSGIAGWQRASNSCLATRIPHGIRIEDRYLAMVEAAEIEVKKIGIDITRVRCDRDIARIEVLPADIQLLLQNADRGMLVKRLKSIGFKRVSIDLEGYVRAMPGSGDDEN